VLSKITLFLLLFATCAYAEDQTILNVGVGNFNAAQGNTPDTKMLSIGMQEDVWDALKMRGTVGGWLDSSGNGQTGSGFVAVQLGWEVVSGGMVASIFSGPGIISSPDTVLGGPFQFVSDLHLGIKDRNSNYIGAFYRHISSAGIETPNIGREAFGVEIRF